MALAEQFLKDILVFLEEPEHEIVRVYSDDVHKEPLYCGLALGWEKERDRLLRQLVEGTENKALHDEVTQLRASNKALYEIVAAIFAIEEVSNVRKCRSCGVPVIHMEHLKLDMAKAIEAKARALLQQETKQEEAEEAK